MPDLMAAVRHAPPAVISSQVALGIIDESSWRNFRLFRRFEQLLLNCCPAEEPTAHDEPDGRHPISDGHPAGDVRREAECVFRNPSEL